MKDTVLTARRKKKEIITLLVCFVLSNLMNLYAIITYHRSMMEMITSIFYIIIFAFAVFADFELYVGRVVVNGIVTINVNAE